MAYVRFVLGLCWAVEISRSEHFMGTVNLSCFYHDASTQSLKCFSTAVLLSDGHHDAPVLKRLRGSHNTVDLGENSTIQKW